MKSADFPSAKGAPVPAPPPASGPPERTGTAGWEASFVERTRDLAASHAFLDSLIENLPNMVFVKDARELRFVRFNRAGEELLGLHRADLIGKNDYDFFPKAQADQFTSRDRAVLAGTVAVDIPEEQIQTSRGLRYLHTRKIPLFGTDGHPAFLLGISEDITDKREAEAERLRRTREAGNRRVTLLADASVALSASLDIHETLQRLGNLMVPTLAHWCLITVRERDGSVNRVAGFPDLGADKSSYLDELIRIGPTGRSFVASRIGGGTSADVALPPRYFDVMKALGAELLLVAPVRGREQLHGTILLAAGERSRELTEDDLRTAEELGRRAGIAIDNAFLYQEAQEAVASRDAFLSIASHELKTPLTSLTIQAQLRRRQLDRENYDLFTPEKLRRMVDSDARQLDRLNRLIDDMLDVSRIGTGKLTVHPEPVNLLQLVREVAERHGDQYAKSGCELFVAGDDHVVGLWDRFRIEQVVTNLLSNALKYGAGQPVRIQVTDRGREAVLEVRDQGIGIAPQDQDRIFRQFERAVGPSGATGLGLGLYIVKQILELHAGSIRVESMAGEGSCFTITLPAR